MSFRDVVVYAVAQNDKLELKWRMSTTARNEWQVHKNSRGRVRRIITCIRSLVDIKFSDFVRDAVLTRVHLNDSSIWTHIGS